MDILHAGFLTNFLSQYEGAPLGRTADPSPAIWSRLNGSVVGQFDHFVNLNKGATQSATDWLVDESDDNATLILLDSVRGGVARLGLAADDNEEVWMSSSGGQGAPFMIDTGEPVLGFECRFRISSVVDDYIAIKIGLCEPKAVGADVHHVDDTGEISDADFVGFRNVHVNSGTTGLNATLDAVYLTASGAVTDAVAGIQTMVANTWYKVGFLFDGTATMSYFVDGVVNATTHSVEASGFPDGEEMAMVIAAKSGDGTAVTFDVDWAMCVQGVV